MKTLKVRISNGQLNALEDLLYCVLKPWQQRDAEQKARKLWHSLVIAWDKPGKK